MFFNSIEWKCIRKSKWKRRVSPPGREAGLMTTERHFCKPRNRWRSVSHSDKTADVCDIEKSSRVKPRRFASSSPYVARSIFVCRSSVIVVRWLETLMRRLMHAISRVVLGLKRQLRRGWRSRTCEYRCWCSVSE